MPVEGMKDKPGTPPPPPTAIGPPLPTAVFLVRLGLVRGGGRAGLWVGNAGDGVHHVVHGGEGVELRAHDGLGDRAQTEEPRHERLALLYQVSLQEGGGRVAQVAFIAFSFVRVAVAAAAAA